MCPLLVPNDDAVSGSYAQPVNVAENLSLMTLNIPPVSPVVYLRIIIMIIATQIICIGDLLN